MKYKDWLEEWLEHYIRPTSKIRTYERYKELTLHITAEMGDYELNDLSPMVLQKFVSDLLIAGNRKMKRGLSTNPVN